MDTWIDIEECWSPELENLYNLNQSKDPVNSNLANAIILANSHNFTLNLSYYVSKDTADILNRLVDHYEYITIDTYTKYIKASKYWFENKADFTRSIIGGLFNKEEDEKNRNGFNTTRGFIDG